MRKNKKTGFAVGSWQLAKAKIRTLWKLPTANCKLILILIATIIYGCSQTLYMPASTDATEQQQLVEGRKLYVDHCSSCHNLHFPKEFTAEQWKKQLDEMQFKAKISDTEKQQIFHYLTSQR